MKKPRLIALMPLRSPRRGATAKMPMTAVITPIIGTISGNTRPALPNASVGLEEVRGHAGAVAHVVADVVRDHRRVTWIVLGNPRLHLADQVRADVGRLRVDAAADAHEHGQQRRAEAEALQHARRVGLEDDHHDRRAEQPQPDREHARDAAGTERDPHRRVLAALLRRRGDAHVAAHGQRHAGEPGERREQRAHQEERRAAPADPGRVRRQQQEDEEDHHDEHAERAELSPEVGRRALLDREGDLAHLRRALAGREHFADQHEGHPEGAQGDHRDDDHPGEVGAGYGSRPARQGEVEP